MCSGCVLHVCTLCYATGLILVPNGKLIGKSLGDRYPGEEALARAKLEAEVAGRRWEDEWDYDDEYGGGRGRGPGGRLFGAGQEDDETAIIRRLQEKARGRAVVATNSSSNNNDENGLASDLGLPIAETHQSHPWGVFFTVLGTVLLDFDADACQSPSRAYLLDVTVPGIAFNSL